jgi:hypothetical protein
MEGGGMKTKEVLLEVALYISNTDVLGRVPANAPSTTTEVLCGSP